MGTSVGPWASPSQVKRRKVVLLRGLLAVSLGGLLLGFPPSGAAAAAAAVLLLVTLGATDLALALTPSRHFERPGFELALGAVDLGLVALGVQLAGASRGALVASGLLMVLVVALGSYRGHAVAGAAAVGAFHSWLVLGPAAGLGTSAQLSLQVLFLCSVGLYFGFLVRGIHVQRRREAVEQLDLHERQALLEILEAIGSSLDLREVTLTIVRKIASVISAVRCSMLFVDPSATRCFVLASHDDPELDLLEIDLKKYPEVRRAIETRNPVIVQNVPDDPILAEVRSLLSGLDFQSILVVPLTFRSQVLGTLCLKTARAKDEFTTREIHFCTAVARASANALQNALLHDQVLDEVGRHRRTSDKLSRILDHSPDLIVTTDHQGRLTEFNRGAERLLGRSRQSVLGQPCAAIFGPDCGQRLIDRIHAEGQLANHACQVRRDDGAELTLELNMAVLGERGGASSGTVWIGRDVTALKAAQLQLLQAKKLSTIGEVVSGIAHELNNPLSGVLGFSQLLLARHGHGALSRELERIHDSALRCQKIVRNLLSFARVHKPERRYLGVNGIIDKTLDLRRYQLRVHGIEVVRRLAADLPRTMVDFHQMQQVFLNLIQNAQQAIAATDRRGGRLTVRTSHADDTIQIEFRDDGVGMDQETLERIFDPFFTTKEPGRGTGLGLSVSYGIVKEHGGRIFARSSLGQGSTIVIQLPVRCDESVPAEPPVPAESSAGVPTPGGRLLIVDDEPLILDLLVDILTDQGYVTDTAVNGADACRKLRERDYDLVVTDVRMPEMNGIELYGEIIAMRPEMDGRVLFMTGDLLDKDTLRFLAEIGAQSVPKPLEIPVILAAVAERLERLHA